MAPAESLQGLLNRKQISEGNFKALSHEAQGPQSSRLMKM